jgi:acetyl esterase/lipase
VRALALLALTGCAGTMESFFAQDVVDEHLDEAYVAGTSDPRQHLDYFLPRGVPAYPIVVFIHGGFWIHQSKDYFQPVVALYRNVGIALARQGIATAVIDYRLAPAVTFDEQFGDVAAAIAWVQANVQDERMVIAGHSAGGHITALAAFDEARLAAAGVDTAAIVGYAPLSPIVDLQMMADSAPEYAAIAAEVFGADLATPSPSTYFRAAVKPLLVLLGGSDEPFIAAQVPMAIEELRALGAPVTFDIVPGHTHDDMVLDFDTDHDAITPLLAPFVLTTAGS